MRLSRLAVVACAGWALLAHAHEPPPRAGAHAKLLETLDAWAEGLKANQALDEATTQRELYGIQVQIDGLIRNKTLTHQVVLFHQEAATAYHEEEVRLPLQQRDAVAIHRGATTLMRQVDVLCDDGGFKKRVDREDARLNFITSLQTYVINALAASRKADLNYVRPHNHTKPNVTFEPKFIDEEDDDEPEPSAVGGGSPLLPQHVIDGEGDDTDLENVPDESRARRSMFHSYVGLAQSTRQHHQALSQHNATHSHPSKPVHDCDAGDKVMWGNTKREFCCSTRHLGCDSPTTTGLSGLVASLGGIHLSFSEHIRRVHAQRTAVIDWCHQHAVNATLTLDVANMTVTSLATDEQRIADRQASVAEELATSEERIGTLADTIADATTQADTIAHSAGLRKKARDEEAEALGHLRRLLLNFGSTGLGASLTNGKSQSTAGRTCLEIKTADPSAHDGLYWIDLGEGTASAFEVYCDMTTDGGGWTLVQKKVMGKATASLSAHAGNHSRPAPAPTASEAVYPGWVSSERVSKTNKKAYDFFAARSRHQWLKTMGFHRAPSQPRPGSPPLVEIISQAIMIKPGVHSMIDLAGAVAMASPGSCTRMLPPVQVYTSRPRTVRLEAGGYDHPVAGHVDLYAGNASWVTAVRAGSSGDGLAAGSASSMDRCGVPLTRGCDSGELVCDTQGLSTVGTSASDVVAGGSARLIASVLSKDCLFNCPEAAFPDEATEVYVWAVRADPCPADEQGTPCSGRGKCMDAACKCEYGYDGDACELAICVEDCVHGVCGVTGECECEPGYLGKSCDVRAVCPPAEAEMGNGSVSCPDGHGYGDTCTYTCDEGYRHGLVDRVALRSWPTMAMCDAHAEPSEVITVIVGDCTLLQGGQRVLVSGPDHLNTVEVSFYAPDATGCAGPPLHSSSTLCGSVCEPAGAHAFAVSCTAGREAVRTCTALPGQVEGNWTGLQPNCVVDGCPILAPPDHGDLLCSGRQQADVCQARCNEGYRHVWAHPDSDGGDARLVCDSGTWTPALPQCLPRDCGQPAHTGHVAYECAGTTFGAQCALSCDPGFEPTATTALEIACGGDGAWIGLDPDACQPAKDAY